jgi:hypothetical protein
MKLYALKCDQGYLRRAETGCQLVQLEKATVVNETGLEGLVTFAATAGQAGFINIYIIELLVTEGKCVKLF